MRGDLTGVRVVAVEQAVAGPLCSRHLADLGAEVIKIERPPGGDFARGYDDAVHGWSTHFVWLNAGKRSVVLDLKSPAGLDAFVALVAQADVLVSNLAPGALDRIVTDAELAEINPRLVRCHITGYGSDGPYADRKAYDALVQGEAGTIRATGTMDQPAKPGVSIADVGGAVYALSSILAALLERSRTGVGKRVDVSLFGVLLEWMSPLLLAERYAGGAPPPAGLGHASIAPYGPRRGADGGEVLVAVQNEDQWRRFCAVVLHSPELAEEPRYRTNAQRVANRDGLDREIDAILSALPSTRIVERLVAADVPFGRLNSTAEVIAHPQAAAAGRWATVCLPGGEDVIVAASPLVSGDGSTRRVPGLGDSTREVLDELGDVSRCRRRTGR